MKKIFICISICFVTILFACKDPVNVESNYVDVLDEDTSKVYYDKVMPLDSGSRWSYEVSFIDTNKYKPKEPDYVFDGTQEVIIERTKEFDGVMWYGFRPRINDFNYFLQKKDGLWGRFEDEEPVLIAKYPIDPGTIFDGFSVNEQTRKISNNLGEIELVASDVIVNVKAGQFKCLKYRYLYLEEYYNHQRGWEKYYCPEVGRILFQEIIFDPDSNKYVPGCFRYELTSYELSK